MIGSPDLSTYGIDGSDWMAERGEGLSPGKTKGRRLRRPSGSYCCFTSISSVELDPTVLSPIGRSGIGCNRHVGAEALGGHLGRRYAVGLEEGLHGPGSGQGEPQVLCAGPPVVGMPRDLHPILRILHQLLGYVLEHHPGFRRQGGSSGLEGDTTQDDTAGALLEQNRATIGVDCLTRSGAAALISQVRNA